MTTRQEGSESFENDIFISYAHIDNLALEEGQDGWIAALHRALELRLAQLLGKKPRIWRDPKLTGNEDYAERLSSELPRAALLISILSPRYLRSDWCRRELTEFLAAVEERSAETSEKSRVFKVVKTPVPLDEQPPELQKMLGYEFFQVDPETGRPHEIDPVTDPETKRQYWARINDLAYDLSEMLALFEELGKATGGNGTASGFSAPTEEKGCVFLADATHDLVRDRDAVRRELKLRGYRVLPEGPLPFHLSDELESAVAEQLAECRMSIHLVGENYGLVPEGTTESVTEIEHRLARARGVEDRDFFRLVWIPPELDSEDQRQLDFVDRLKTESLDQCSELFQTPLESLKSEVVARLEPPEEEEEPAAAEEEDGDDEYVRVYLVCDERDEEATIQLEDFLWDQENFEVLVPAFDGSESEVRLDHQEKLSRADAVVLYYGAGKDLWLSRKLSEIRKSPGYGRKKPWLAKPLIYVAPPASPRKSRYRSREAVVVQGGESFSAEQLEPFVREIREARARTAR